MTYVLGAKSRANLAGVHPRLAAVVEAAIKRSAVDFKVIEGVRTPERQRELYAQGRTKPGNIVTWTLKSNHLVQADGLGHAVDLLVAPYDWKEGPQWKQMADAMLSAAKDLGVRVRWGKDWNQNGKIGEKGETDGPHFEIVL
jgi:peptidoglycan L-alanyl-D-glutamate endopeptidase CwlK